MDWGAKSERQVAKRLGIWLGRNNSLHQSGLAPENFTTLAHFSVSSLKSLANSAGELGSTKPPSSANRAFSLGSARPALIAWLSVAIISGGVLFGAPMPKYALAS